MWGGIAGQEIADKLADLPAPPELGEAELADARAHVNEILARKGDQDLYALRQELRSAMDKHVGVYRSGEGLTTALETIRDIQERALRAPVEDKSRVYNSNLFHALELENLLELAEVTVVGALARQESRGAHSRRDFTTRDDEGWLRHTLAWRTDAGPRLDYKPVTITTWKPVERKY